MPSPLIDPSRISDWYLKHQLSSAEVDRLDTALRQHIASDVAVPSAYHEFEIVGQRSMGWLSSSTYRGNLERDDGSVLPVEIGYNRFEPARDAGPGLPGPFVQLTMARP